MIKNGINGINLHTVPNLKKKMGFRKRVGTKDSIFILQGDLKNNNNSRKIKAKVHW